MENKNKLYINNYIINTRMTVVEQALHVLVY